MLFLNLLVVPVALLSATTSPCGAGEEFRLSRQGSGRATGYAETNKIVTADGKTHVTWLDSNEEGFIVRIRTLDLATGEWSPTYTIGSAKDNHGGPALAIDSKGYLHVAYYPHSAPMRYRKSLRPHDASQWSEEVVFGERLTYPTLVVGPDDTLYLTARRRGARGEKWTILFFKKPPGGAWSSPTTLIEANSPSYFQCQEALAWGPDHKTLHLVGRMYGDVPRWCYLLGYMRTNDFGKTWQRLDGETIGLPADKASLDPIVVIPEDERSLFPNTSDLRCGALAVDRNNVPHVLYNDRGEGNRQPRQARLAMPDGAGGWYSISLNERIDVVPDEWGLGLPGGIAFTPNGRMVILLTMADDHAEQGLWGTPTSEVVYATSDDGGRTFESQVISNSDPSLPNWLPNLEKPTGFNRLPAHPGVIYLSGEKGVDNNVILQNSVFFWRQASRL